MVELRRVDGELRPHLSPPCPGRVNFGSPGPRGSYASKFFSLWRPPRRFSPAGSPSSSGAEGGHVDQAPRSFGQCWSSLVMTSPPVGVSRNPRGPGPVIWSITLETVGRLCPVRRSEAAQLVHDRFHLDVRRPSRRPGDPLSSWRPSANAPHGREAKVGTRRPKGGHSMSSHG